MYYKIFSEALNGVESVAIDVEADVSSGLPCFDMVGYLSSEVKEAKERVRTALKNSGFSLPPKRITVNLSPADFRKEGSAYDLAIAVAILAATGYVIPDELNETVLVGELSLSGQILSVKGILSMVHHAMKTGKKKILVPKENELEGAVIRGIQVIGIASLVEAVDYLNKKTTILPAGESEIQEEEDTFSQLDYCDIYGQNMVKRAVEIAAGGMHNFLMVGAPGAGKSMMAKRIPTILPELEFEESVEVSKIYSVKGLLTAKGGLIKRRPFRSPHHTISPYALTGGGRIPSPGEMSMAHKGVLFLDELPEFSKNVLEVMRQPLEDGKITIARVNGTYTFPADFMLVAAMNPCPCGYFPDRERCQCSDEQIKRYLNRLSQPLLDRIDICVETNPVPYEALVKKGCKGETSKSIANRVKRVRQIQKERYKSESISFNSELSVNQIDEYCKMEPEGSGVLEQAYESMKLSARGYHRVLRVARTIADYEESNIIKKEHLMEALGYRDGKNQFWGRV